MGYWLSYHSRRRPDIKKIANGILVSLPEGELNQSKTVRLLVVNDEVLQVTASPEAKIQDKQSLVRVAR